MSVLAKLLLAGCIVFVALLVLVGLRFAHQNGIIRLRAYETGLILVSLVAGVALGGLLP